MFFPISLIFLPVLKKRKDHLSGLIYGYDSLMSGSACQPPSLPPRTKISVVVAAVC
jgi:hypothetical protein